MVHILYLLILHNSLLWVWEHSIVPSTMEGEVDLHEFLFEDWNNKEEKKLVWGYRRSNSYISVRIFKYIHT